MWGLSPRVRGTKKMLALGQLDMVYPRVCGGTAAKMPPTTYYDGLSPRVRGNRPFTPPLNLPLRSIPACAGEPKPGRLRVTRSSVYPRVCGGTCLMGHHQYSMGGLSPRVRGNPRGRTGGFAGGGSIPACAGEPSRRSCARVPGEVYPRVCGGTKPSWAVFMSSYGLSPRVRGNPSRASPSEAVKRSIPRVRGNQQPNRNHLG